MTDEERTAAWPNAARLTGREVFFDLLVSNVAANQPGAADRASVVSRLEAFRPRYFELYCEVLEQHLGQEEAKEAVALLATPEFCRYVRARRAMAKSLAEGIQHLCNRIGELRIDQS